MKREPPPPDSNLKRGQPLPLRRAIQRMNVRYAKALERLAK
ncbi:hypothetical protein BH11ARM2_BH11ARM2_35070 [soil metagenome]